MLNAFRFGAPPHGGLAPGIDRIVMLLAGQTAIREVIAFPLNQQGQDLLMNAPSEVEPSASYKELHIRLSPADQVGELAPCSRRRPGSLAAPQRAERLAGSRRSLRWTPAFARGDGWGLSQAGEPVGTAT